jgi:ribose transport system permease protein
MSSAALILRSRRLLPAASANWTPLSTALILAALIATDLALQPALLDVFQIGLEVETALTLVLLGLAQTLVVLVRGIDLSVGGIMVVSNALAATWVGGAGGTHQWLLLVVLGFGCAMGALNGTLVAFLDFQPFVATLATWTIFNGIALWILPTDGGAAPPALTRVVNASIGSVPASFVILAGLLIFWWYLRGTRFGHAIYAIGSDEDRAQLNGEAAVVIGGTSLLGGAGGFGLTVMATFVLTIIADVVAALNLSVWVSVAASAGLLLVVVGARSYFEARWRPET